MSGDPDILRAQIELCNNCAQIIRRASKARFAGGSKTKKMLLDYFEGVRRDTEKYLKNKNKTSNSHSQPG